MAKDTRSVALVLEGGGYRGIFTAGILDVLMEHALTDEFASVWGTSAGAMNAIDLKSRQIGRTMRIMLAYRDDRRFMSFTSLVRTGNLTGGDFVYDEVQNRLDPCDCDAFNTNPMRMYAVASDVVFGTAAYLPVNFLPKDIVKVRASASLPLVSQIVEIDGHRYLDGGTTDSIPYAVALGLPDAVSCLPQGYTPSARAIVVITQDRSYEKTQTNEMIAIRSHRYDDYPYYLEALRTRYLRYNAQREMLWKLEKQGKALVFAPEEPVKVATNEREGGPLLSLYLQGRHQAQERLAEVETFLHARTAMSKKE